MLKITVFGIMATHFWLYVVVGRNTVSCEWEDFESLRVLGLMCFSIV